MAVLGEDRDDPGRDTLPVPLILLRRLLDFPVPAPQPSLHGERSSRMSKVPGPFTLSSMPGSAHAWYVCAYAKHSTSGKLAASTWTILMGMGDNGFVHRVAKIYVQRIFLCGWACAPVMVCPAVGRRHMC